MIQRVISLFIFFFLVSCSSDNQEITPTETFIKAVDMSFLPLIESEGTTYKNASNTNEDALETLKKAGCNTIRIRIWHTPESSTSSFNEVKNFCQRIKNKGMKVWLCVHYSDTWADPGHQQKPQAWQNLSFEQLKIAVENYTATLATALQPEIMQIGNETNSGFLFPEGNLLTNENQFLTLLKAASVQIRTKSPNTKIMLHYAGIEGSTWFFSKTVTVDYDFIGLSYYPIWHGNNFNLLQNTITYLGENHNKKILVAETAYPFTLNWNDWTNNIVGTTDQLHPDFEASNLGQKNFIIQLQNTIKSSKHGHGFCYWGAEWVAFRGTQATNGSSWENQALWDFNLKALPVLEAFN